MSRRGAGCRGPLQQAVDRTPLRVSGLADNVHRELTLVRSTVRDVQDEEERIMVRRVREVREGEDVHGV
eukprot:36630-Eustigmatos_ZCMA.PRE.1